MHMIRTRIDTLLNERGIKWSEVYRKLGWSKGFASMIRNGKIIPPLWQRIALAKVLELSSEQIIWDEPILISAYEMQKKEALE